MSVTRVCCSGQRCWEGQLKDTSPSLHKSLLSSCRSTEPQPKLHGSTVVLQCNIILFSGSWETLGPKCWVLLQQKALTLYINTCTFLDTTSCHFVPTCCWQPVDYKKPLVPGQRDWIAGDTTWCVWAWAASLDGMLGAELAWSCCCSCLTSKTSQPRGLVTIFPNHSKVICLTLFKPDLSY